MESPLKNPVNEGVGSPKKFQTGFCEAYHCTPQEFPEKLFSTTLYPHARIPVMILKVVFPKYFGMDREFIRDVGETEHPDMFRGEIDIYYGNNLRSRSWLRNKFLIRISGSKMKQVGEQVFGKPMR